MSASVSASRVRTRRGARGLTRELTLLEIVIALGLFTVVGVGMLTLYMSNLRVAQASEEEANTTAAMREQLALVHQLEVEGGSGHAGLDAVIWNFLRNPSFDVARTSATAPPNAGQVVIQTDLDGDGDFEDLVDSDSDGLGASEAGSGVAISYDAARLRYEVDVIRVVFRVSFRSLSGGVTTREHVTVLTRKEGQG